jgi:RecB family endonuclease NucS
MVRHHFVALRKADGGYEYVRLKHWLLVHPEYNPPGMSPKTHTSHQLRNALSNRGWPVKFEPDRVLIFVPEEVAAIQSTPLEDEELVRAEEITFGLERDMQVALRSNIEQLEQGLRIIDGGVERNTEAGRVDITASDKAENLVVIELKAGIAPPESIAQVLSYMGVIAESDRKEVRGILVAGDFHRRTILAARAVPNLQLRKYSFQFKFEDVM